MDVIYYVIYRPIQKLRFIYKNLYSERFHHILEIHCKINTGKA